MYDYYAYHSPQDGKKPVKRSAGKQSLKPETSCFLPKGRLKRKNQVSDDLFHTFQQMR